MMFERKPETVARTGLPIVQAISDYQCDHGLVPLALEDLVPTYLPEKPKEWRWSFQDGRLGRHADQPHSYVDYWFDGHYAGQWRFIGDSSHQHRQLNVPGPVRKPSATTGESLFVLSLAEYEHRIKRHSTNILFYADKINYLVKEEHNELLQSECERAVELFPDWWLPRMALAKLGKFGGEAERRFETWVHEHGTFNNYWYLSRHYRDKDKPEAALESLNKALDQPIIKEPQDSSWLGARCLFDACSFAYQSRDDELALKLARLWELRGTTDGEKSWLAFEAAAELRLGQFEAAVAHASKIVDIARRYEPWAKNLDELLRATQTRDTNFVYQAGNPEPPWLLFAEPNQ